jgi:hypothetical protein
LTLALKSKNFAKYVVKKTIVEDQDPPGAWMHATARRRHNAKMLREGVVHHSQLKDTGRPKNQPTLQPTSQRSLWSGEQLRQKLLSYDRTPFLDLLAIWMECLPTPQTIMAFADKYPDRWVKAMTDLGRLGGFADKKEIDFNFAAQVAGMSDSQLEDHLQEAAYRLGIPLPALITMMADQQTSPSQVPRSREALDLQAEPLPVTPSTEEKA